MPRPCYLHLSEGVLPGEQDPKKGRCEAPHGGAWIPTHTECPILPFAASLLGRRQPQKAASCPGGLRQPCGATLGQRSHPQLVWGQAELTADGQAHKQTSISLCASSQVSQIGSVGCPVPHSPITPLSPSEVFVIERGESKVETCSSVLGLFF